MNLLPLDTIGEVCLHEPSLRQILRAVSKKYLILKKLKDSSMVKVVAESEVSFYLWYIKRVKDIPVNKILKLAIAKDNTAVAKRLWKGNLVPSSIFEIACERANIELLEHAKSHYRLPWEDSRYSSLSECGAASGSIDVIRWLMNNGYKVDDDALGSAVVHGHIHLVEYLCAETSCEVRPHMLLDACGAGKLEMAKYLTGKGLIVDQECTWQAALGGHFDVMNWCLQTVEMPEHDNSHTYNDNCFWCDTCVSACQHENLEILKWAHAHGGRLTSCFLTAIPNRKIMSWLIEHGCEINRQAFGTAAMEEDIDTVEFLFGRGLKPYDMDAFELLHIDTSRVIEIFDRYNHVLECGPPHDLMGYLDRLSIRALRWLCDRGARWTRLLEFLDSDDTVERLNKLIAAGFKGGGEVHWRKFSSSNSAHEIETLLRKLGIRVTRL
jgi:ferredoxin